MEPRSRGFDRDVVAVLVAEGVAVDLRVPELLLAVEEGRPDVHLRLVEAALLPEAVVAAVLRVVLVRDAVVVVVGVLGVGDAVAVVVERVLVLVRDAVTVVVGVLVVGRAVVVLVGVLDAVRALGQLGGVVLVVRSPVVVVVGVLVVGRAVVVGVVILVVRDAVVVVVRSSRSGMPSPSLSPPVPETPEVSSCSPISSRSFLAARRPPCCWRRGCAGWSARR